MRTPQQVAAASGRGRTGCLVRGLAVVGALALVAVLVGAVAIAGIVRGAGDPPPPVTPTAAPAVSPAPPGDLAEGEAWLPDVDVATARLVTDRLDLREVRLRGRGARTNADGTVRVEAVQVDAIMPFDAVEAQVGGGLQLAPAGNGLVRATQSMSLLGRSVEVTADAAVRGEGRQIVIEPRQVYGAGALGGLVDRLPPIRRPVEDLPEGLNLTRVEVVDSGFRVRAEGAGVTLAR